MSMADRLTSRKNKPYETKQRRSKLDNHHGRGVLLQLNICKPDQHVRRL